MNALKFKLLAMTVAEEYTKISKYWTGERNKNCLHVTLASLLTLTPWMQW